MDKKGQVTSGILLWVGAALLLLAGFGTIGKNIAKKTRPLLLIGGLVVGFLAMGGNLGGLFDGSPLAVAPGTTTTADGTATVQKFAIETLSVDTREKTSNSGSAVGNATAGFVRIYQKDINPSNPNANPIVSVNMTSGTGSDTTGRIKTETDYRVVFDGNGNGHYSVDCGIMKFPNNQFNPNTGQFTLSLGTNGAELCPGAADGIAIVGTISDMIDENTTNGDVNGDTAVTSSSELVNASGADTLVYDESNADGTVYVELTFEVTTANAEAHDLVVGIKWDATNRPEGNEITDMTVTQIDGTDFGITSDWDNIWSNEGSVSLGSVVESGSRGQYRFTFTVDETSYDSNDDWRFFIDDLGDEFGKDVRLNTGAARDTLTIDNQA